MRARLPRRLKKDVRAWFAGGRASLRLRRWAFRAARRCDRVERAPIPITAEDLDRKFDAGEDISMHVDWTSARRPGLERRR